MGMFKIEIKLTGTHACDRTAKPGEKLHGRCRRLDCADCRTLDFIQMLRQFGSFRIGEATMTHFTGSQNEIVDDLLKNERVSGEF